MLLLFMAASVLTLHAANPEQSGSSAGLLTLTAPTASTSTTGWTVSNTVTNRHSRQTFRTEKATTTFSVVTEPYGPPLAKAVDCWRLSTATTGQFSAGTWYSSLSVIAVTAGGAADGNAAFRLYACSNASGTETVYDDFNRANNADLGAGFTPQTSAFAFAISSNAAAVDSGGNNSAEYSTAINPSAAQFSWCCLGTIETGTTGDDIGAGCFVHGKTGDQSKIAVLARVNRIVLGRFGASSFDSLFVAYTAVAPVLGDWIVLTTDGAGTYKVYKNGAEIISRSDTSYSSGSVGIAGKAFGNVPTILEWAGGSGTPLVRELTKGIMRGTNVTNVSTTVAQSSSASTQITTSNVTDEFLFMQVAWQRTGAGSATNHDILARVGPLGRSGGDLIGSGLETPLFTTPAAGGASPAGGGYYLGRRRDPMTGAS